MPLQKVVVNLNTQLTDISVQLGGLDISSSVRGITIVQQAGKRPVAKLDVDVNILRVESFGFKIEAYDEAVEDMLKTVEKLFFVPPSLREKIDAIKKAKVQNIQ